MIRSSLMLAALTTGGMAVAQEPEWVRDPFSRPELPRAIAQAGPAESPAATLELRGILLAGKHSVVNLGGTIVALGEAVDGYLLTEVGEGEAVFLKDNESIRIRLKGQEDQLR